MVAATDLEPGSPLTAENLTLVDWPANIPIEGAATSIAAFVGRIALFPVAEKQPIRETLLAPAESTLGLTAKVPEGMRAAAVKTNELNNVAGFVFPGSHVDVLVTFRPENGMNLMTITVLQNVEVLSTGEKLHPDASSGKPQNVNVVTLLLTPDLVAPGRPSCSSGARHDQAS